MLLKELGVDRVIDYKAEDIKTVCLLKIRSSVLLSFLDTMWGLRNQRPWFIHVVQQIISR